MTAGNSLAKSREEHGGDGRIYAIASFSIGVLVGFSAVRTGFSYYFAGWPAHGPVGVLGVFFMVFGLAIVLGSVLVLVRKARLLGAVLILVFGIVTGAQGAGMLVYDVGAYVLGWVLPIASFVFALYSWKLDRVPSSAKASKK